MTIGALCVVAAALLPAVHPQAVAAQPQATQPVVGTLHIDAKLPVGSVRGDYFEAGWLFLNNDFIGRLPIDRQLMLAPGSYTVRVVVGAYTHEQPRYYTVRWPRVVVSQGATQTMQLERAILATIDGQSPPGVELTAGDDPMPWSHLTANEGMVEYFRKTAFDEMERQWERFHTTGDFATVLAVAQQAEKAPPSRPLVWIDISDVRGGPRQFDADQLRFLARSLRPDIGGWRHKIVQFPPSLPPELRAFFEKQIAALKQMGAEYDGRVDAVIRVITQALEKRRQPRP